MQQSFIMTLIDPRRVSHIASMTDLHMIFNPLIQSDVDSHHAGVKGLECASSTHISVTLVVFINPIVHAFFFFSFFMLFIW